MANIIEVILKANDQTGSTFSKFNSSFQAMTGVSLGAAGGIALATKAIQAAVQYTKQAIEANDKYVSSIVDMARFTGDEVDAMSRLVQVADDAFLSQEALNNAMSIGAKKGLDMSVEGIKKLADEYNALATPQEKAKLLNDNFGRSGLAMGKLLEQGSAGITKNMEAIESNLVVTQKSVKIAYDYKRSVDAATDAQDAFAYSVAQGTMPALTKLNNQWAKTVTAINESGGATKTLEAGSWMLEGALVGLQVVFSGYTKNLVDSAATAEVSADRYDKMASSIFGVGESAVLTEEQIKALNDAEVERYKTTTSLAIDLTKSDEDLLIAEKDLADYIKNNPWDNQGIQDRKDAVNKLKQEQQRMVDSWMLNVFTTMALADQKLSDDEQAFLLQYQVDTDMISQENADRAASYWIMANSIFNANAGIQGSINSLQGKDLYIVTHYTNEQGHGSGTVTVPENIPIIYPSSPTNYGAGSIASSYANQHRANGGDVYAGQAYWVGERGPEPFIPKQNGTIIPNNKMGGLTINVSGNTLLGDSRTMARELARIIQPELNRLIGINA